MVAPTAAAPSCLASRTVPNRIWSYLLGYVRSSLWLSLQMNGMRCAYLRATEPSTPKVDATALQPPSIASSTSLPPSKYSGFGAKDAPAECSMPWSIGKIGRASCRERVERAGEGGLGDGRE